jgi:hypothetical protein
MAHRQVGGEIPDQVAVRRQNSSKAKALRELRQTGAWKTLNKLLIDHTCSLDITASSDFGKEKAAFWLISRKALRLQCRRSFTLRTNIRFILFAADK